MRLIDADALLEQYGLKYATKYGNKNAKQQEHSYSTMMMYEIADMIEDAPTAYDIDKVLSELVKSAKEIHGNVGMGGEMVVNLDDAIEIVKQEEEKYNNGWIPCSERLPEERINPVTQDYYQYPVMFENDGVEDIKYYYFGNGHWRYGLQIMDCFVTHWMDIKPYQPKGE